MPQPTSPGSYLIRTQIGSANSALNDLQQQLEQLGMVVATDFMNNRSSKDNNDAYDQMQAAVTRQVAIVKGLADLASLAEMQEQAEGLLPSDPPFGP
jgi:hypothetical protein